MAHLTVKMVGTDENHGTVALADFAGFCRGLETCLNKISKIAAENARLAYRISSISSGSITMTVAVHENERSAYLHAEKVRQGNGRSRRRIDCREMKEPVTRPARMALSFQTDVHRFKSHQRIKAPENATT